MFLFAFFTTLSSLAATITTCELPTLNAQVEIRFERTPGENGGGLVTTRLAVEEAEVPMLRKNCYLKDVPGQRGYLCAHQGPDTDRFDIYPQFESVRNGIKWEFNGVLKKLNVIRWSEDGIPTRFETEDCR